MRIPVISGHRGQPHAPGLFRRVVERIRGREQLLVRSDPEYPLLLLSYPRSARPVAHELETIYAHVLPSLNEAIRRPYAPMLACLPALVVVLLRPLNLCGCLGHHHLPETESRLARRLRTDLNSIVGEIDLAFDSIRAWQPLPISSLAAEGLAVDMPRLHFQAAMMAVLLHELEHLAHPDRWETQVRTASNEFYSAVMKELVRKETGAAYGMLPPS